MLGKCNLAARNSRLTLECGKGRAVLATGAALDAFLQLIFDPFEWIGSIVIHKIKPFKITRRNGEHGDSFVM